MSKKWQSIAVICGFVYFRNAHEKQQVFMQTVKCCVVVCVCVCGKRERERNNRHSEFTTQAQNFFFFFFSRGGGGVCPSSARRPVRQINSWRQFVIIIYNIHAADSFEKWSLWLHGYGKFDMLKLARVDWLRSQLVSSDHCH